MRSRILTVVFAVWVLFGAGACALLSKQNPQPTRYFTARYNEPASPAPTASMEGTQRGANLRIGRVSAAPSVREPIAYRTSDTEIHYYETRRWSERPEAYLEQALSRSLFETHGMTMVISGNAPTLQVQLTIFEEDRSPPHRARIEVVVMLHDAGLAKLRETLRVEENVSASADAEMGDAVASAFSRALQRVVEGVAERCIRALDTPAPQAAATSP